MRPNVTTDLGARCLNILTVLDGPMAAADIAARLGLDGSRESQRRHVRAIVKQLRDCGSKIVGTPDGCFLTEDEAMWREYLNGKQIDAKRVLAEVSRRRKKLSNGQGLLFTEPVRSAIGH